MRKLRLTIEIGLTLFFPRVGWVYPILKKGQSDTFSDTEQWKYGRTKWKFATRYQPNYSMLWRGRLFSLDLTYLCVCVCVFLYNIVLVLPYIDMNLPWVYMCSPSWTPLPHPTPYHPSGLSQCTSRKHAVSCIGPELAIHLTYDNIHVSMPFSQIISPSPSPRVQKTVLYICVSFAVSHTGLSLPSF